MKFRSMLICGLLAGTGAASFGQAGGAGAAPIAEKMVVPPMGTVLTFHRKSSGSLGNFDGQVVWTYAQSTWEGRPAIAFGSPQAGVSLHDPADFAMFGSLNPAGQPALAFDPPLSIGWPLEVGKTWRTNVTLIRLPSGEKTPLTIDYKVEAWEDVTVPAGTFKAYRTSWRNNLGETEVRWFNPMEGLATIKRQVERPATHPMGAGTLQAELLSRALPGK
jgi:hypothetical protein